MSDGNMTVIPTAALPKDIEDVEEAARFMLVFATQIDDAAEQQRLRALAGRLKLHALRLEGK